MCSILEHISAKLRKKAHFDQKKALFEEKSMMMKKKAKKEHVLLKALSTSLGTLFPFPV